jgi:hypothetical protein
LKQKAVRTNFDGRTVFWAKHWAIFYKRIWSPCSGRTFCHGLADVAVQVGGGGGRQAVAAGADLMKTRDFRIKSNFAGL